MGGYIANFTVYTMAMVGLIFFALFIYKKFMDGTMSNRNSKFLEVEETMSLNPRKTLHIIRAGNEKFLIASDVDRTTLISKLDYLTNKPVQTLQNPQENPFINKEISQNVDKLFNNDNGMQQLENVINIEKANTIRQDKTIKLDPVTRKKKQTTVNMYNQYADKYSQQNSTQTLKGMVSKINQL